jgi:trehalose 6-phosphate synthase
LSRLVTVSNRVALPKPASVPGGLAVGILAALRASGGLWFGWNGEVDGEEGAGIDVSARDGITFATIALPRELHELSYNGFANGTLWPLFHYFLDGFRYHDREYAAYQAVNERFARELLPLLRPDDLIWVHDYHLIPLAQKLRALGVRCRIGFFLHIPFPHFEVLRALPRFPELMQALLEYDVVGFQTDTDRHAFLGTLQSMWGDFHLRTNGRVMVGDRPVVVDVFPIGVDVEAIARSAATAWASAPVQKLHEGLVGKRLIVGVDRLDYSKGLLERFEAYRRFLEEHPQQLGKVTYLQIAPLGRQNVEAYVRIRDSLEQSAGRTNGRFADAHWTPIRYLNRNFPHGTLMGFLRAAQVCLVTPVRDGMNLVAKEFVAAQDPADPGVLILSDRTGAACELADAVLVNPYDAQGIAAALDLALSMPLAERQARHAKMLAKLRDHDIHRWRGRFVEALKGAQACSMLPGAGRSAG